MNIDPRDLTTYDWCHQTTLGLAPFLVVPTLLDENGWREWARIIMQSPALQKFDIPDPAAFTDWREWAIRFNQGVPL